MLLKVHRYLGIMLVFFVLLLSITGSLLQHAEDFNLRHKYASSSVVKYFYKIKPCKVLSYQIDYNWLSICDASLYFNDKKIATNLSNNDTFNSAIKKGSLYNIDYGNHIFTVNKYGEIIKLIHKDKNRIYKKYSLIEQRELINTAPASIRENIEENSISKTITYERIIVDLHTGRIFGSVGITIIDLVTLGFILLSMTGTISWLKYKKIF